MVISFAANRLRADCVESPVYQISTLIPSRPSLDGKEFQMIYFGAVPVLALLVANGAVEVSGN